MEGCHPERHYQARLRMDCRRCWRGSKRSSAMEASLESGSRVKVMIPSCTRHHFISFTWTKKLSYQALTMITSCMDHGNRRIRRQQYVSYSTVQTHENLFIACSSGMKVIISTRYDCSSHSKPTYSAGASVFIHFKKAFDTIHRRKFWN